MTVPLTSAGEAGQSSDSARLMLVMECSLRTVGGKQRRGKEGEMKDKTREEEEKGEEGVEGESIKVDRR